MQSNESITKFKKFTWFNLIDNGEPEIRYLRDNFQFNKSHIEDVANPPLRPKIEFSKNYVFLIVLFPIYNRKTGIISVTELDIFANKGQIITVHKNEINAIKDLAQKMENDPAFREKYRQENSIIFLLDLIESMNLSLYPMLNHISWDIDNIDSKLFTGRERELVSEVLAIKRNIVSIGKTMSAHKNVLEELEQQSREYFGPVRLSHRFLRLINLSKDIWLQLETHKSTIAAIQESNESFITFRLNDIMKTLTIFSVIVFPLTLLAAIFGMNTIEGMPFMGHNGFWKVMAVMLVGVFFMFGFFKKNRWI